MRALLCATILLVVARAAAADEAKPVPLFDGKTLDGWEGNLKLFRVEDGAIVAGTLKERIARNEFLCTTKEYGDFELRLKVKLVGEGANAGIQFRTKRIPNHHEVSGYQADMGDGWWGKLYDESRRNRVLAEPPKGTKVKVNAGDWNDYVIRCEGPRIQLWLNGVKTVDYTEKDDKIARTGIIGLQIHGGPPSEASYKDITIMELGKAAAKPTNAEKRTDDEKRTNAEKPTDAAKPADAAKPTGKQRSLLKTFREEFLHITPGKGEFPAEFTMGDDAGPASARPAHKVSFGYDFHIARYEVPQNLWEAVMGTNPSRWKGPRNSVEMLSYEEAVEFCEKATRLMRAAKLIDDKQVIRLPSEAEWEYVARAGTTTSYSFGDNAKDLGDYGWFTGNAKGNDPPVGAKKPNPWGVYDVHGYLWEWCSDSWHENYKGAPTDGSAWTKDGDDDKRVARGGSWKDTADKLASGYRRAFDRDTRDDAVGLRCVLAEAAVKDK